MVSESIEVVMPNESYICKYCYDYGVCEECAKVEIKPCCKGWHNDAHELDCPNRLLKRIESLEIALRDAEKRIRKLENFVLR